MPTYNNTPTAQQGLANGSPDCLSSGRSALPSAEPSLPTRLAVGIALKGLVEAVREFTAGLNELMEGTTT